MTAVNIVSVWSILLPYFWKHCHFFWVTAYSNLVVYKVLPITGLHAETVSLSKPCNTKTVGMWSNPTNQLFLWIFQTGACRREFFWCGDKPRSEWCAYDHSSSLVEKNRFENGVDWQKVEMTTVERESGSQFHCRFFCPSQSLVSFSKLRVRILNFSKLRVRILSPASGRTLTNMTVFEWVTALSWNHI